MWRYGWIESVSQDLRYAVRTMRRARGFTTVAILTMGLGIGATSAVFSVVNSVLLKPLPYPKANRVLMLWRLAPVSTDFGGEEYPWGKQDFTLFREQTKTFEALGAFEAETFNLTGLEKPLFLEGSRASAGFFPALGVAPAIGRVYAPYEDRPGHERVVVLSDRLWRGPFGANKNIIGRPIELNGLSYSVIGVMPPGFSFPHAEEMPSVLELPREAQLWVPLAIAPGERGPNELAVIGRMRKGATIAQVRAELNIFAGTYARLVPAAKAWSKSRAVPLENQIVGNTQRPLLLLLGAVGLVLFIACSNVAGLVLTRSLGRRREFNLRSALGAGYGRLLGQMLAENLLIAAVAGSLGLALAEAGARFVKTFGPVSFPRLQDITVNPAVFVFCAGITLLTGLIFGFAPAVGLADTNLAHALKTGSRTLAAHVSARVRSGLVIGQVALALVLIVAAGLLLRTFRGLLAADRGFKVEHVLTFEISLPAAKYPDPDKMARLYSRTLHTLQTVPGVQSAGLVHAVPMGGVPDSTVIRVPGFTPRPDEQPYANYMFASPGYFATVRTPLLQGRDFTAGDTLDSMPVTIVNRAMAEALWPDGNAVGKHVGVASTKFPVRTIIGVVANVKQNSLREDAAPEMYVPYTQNEIKVWPPMQTMQVALRTAADPEGTIKSVRQAMHTVDPDLPLARVATLTALVNQSLAQTRFGMLLLIAFGVLSLVLTSVGLYGVISHSVAQRIQEIGIRMALGATRGAVLAMVLRQGARLAVVGIVLGLMAAQMSMRTLSSFLYGVHPVDPLTFGIVSAVLALVALLACYVPARRATRVDPVIALRNE